jgi:hypothetical protein
METPRVFATSRRVSRRRTWLGIALIALGLLGHLLVERSISGRAMAYGYHIFAFLLLLLASGAIVAGVGRLFWRGRHDITLVVIGAVQVLFALLTYLEPIIVRAW